MSYIPATLRLWRWPHAAQMLAGHKASEIVKLHRGERISWQFGDFIITVRRRKGKTIRLAEYRSAESEGRCDTD